MQITMPVYLGRNNYHGKDRRLQEEAERWNSDAAAVEKHLTSLLRNQSSPAQEYHYGDIASGAGVDESIVTELLRMKTGGTYSFTHYLE